MGKSQRLCVIFLFLQTFLQSALPNFEHTDEYKKIYKEIEAEEFAKEYVHPPKKSHQSNQHPFQQQIKLMKRPDNQELLNRIQNDHLQMQNKSGLERFSQFYRYVEWVTAMFGESHKDSLKHWQCDNEALKLNSPEIYAECFEMHQFSYSSMRWVKYVHFVYHKRNWSGLLADNEYPHVAVRPIVANIMDDNNIVAIIELAEKILNEWKKSGYTKFETKLKWENKQACEMVNEWATAYEKSYAHNLELFKNAIYKFYMEEQLVLSGGSCEFSAFKFALPTSAAGVKKIEAEVFARYLSSFHYTESNIEDFALDFVKFYEQRKELNQIHQHLPQGQAQKLARNPNNQELLERVATDNEQMKLKSPKKYNFFPIFKNNVLWVTNIFGQSGENWKCDTIDESVTDKAAIYAECIKMQEFSNALVRWVKYVHFCKNDRKESWDSNSIDENEYPHVAVCPIVANVRRDIVDKIELAEKILNEWKESKFTKFKTKIKWENRNACVMVKGWAESYAKYSIYSDEDNARKFEQLKKAIGTFYEKEQLVLTGSTSKFSQLDEWTKEMASINMMNKEIEAATSASKNNGKMKEKKHQIEPESGLNLNAKGRVGGTDGNHSAKIKTGTAGQEAEGKKNGEVKLPDDQKEIPTSPDTGRLKGEAGVITEGGKKDEEADIQDPSTIITEEANKKDHKMIERNKKKEEEREEEVHLAKKAVELETADAKAPTQEDFKDIEGKQKLENPEPIFTNGSNKMGEGEKKDQEEVHLDQKAMETGDAKGTKEDFKDIEDKQKQKLRNHDGSIINRGSSGQSQIDHNQPLNGQIELQLQGIKRDETNKDEQKTSSNNRPVEIQIIQENAVNIETGQNREMAEEELPLKKEATEDKNESEKGNRIDAEEKADKEKGKHPDKQQEDCQGVEDKTQTANKEEILEPPTKLTCEEEKRPLTEVMEDVKKNGKNENEIEIEIENGGKVHQGVEKHPDPDIGIEGDKGKEEKKDKIEKVKKEEMLEPVERLTAEKKNPDAPKEKKNIGSSGLIKDARKANDRGPKKDGSKADKGMEEENYIKRIQANANLRKNLKNAHSVRTTRNGQVALRMSQSESELLRKESSLGGVDQTHHGGHKKDNTIDEGKIRRSDKNVNANDEKVPLRKSYSDRGPKSEHDGGKYDFSFEKAIFEYNKKHIQAMFLNYLREIGEESIIKCPNDDKPQPQKHQQPQQLTVGQKVKGFFGYYAKIPIKKWHGPQQQPKVEEDKWAENCPNWKEVKRFVVTFLDIKKVPADIFAVKLNDDKNKRKIKDQQIRHQNLIEEAIEGLKEIKENGRTQLAPSTWKTADDREKDIKEFYRSLLPRQNFHKLEKIPSMTQQMNGHETLKKQDEVKGNELMRNALDAGQNDAHEHGKMMNLDGASGHDYGHHRAVAADRSFRESNLIVPMNAPQKHHNGKSMKVNNGNGTGNNGGNVGKSATGGKWKSFQHFGGKLLKNLMLIRN